MDDEYDHIMPHKKHKHHGAIKMKLLAVVIIVVILLAAGFAYYFTGSPMNISSSTTVKVGSSGAVFSLGGNTYVATLAGYNKNIQTGYLYITGLPVFLNPVLNLTLAKNNTVKVNYDGQYAIMEFTLISGNSSAVSVKIAPLSSTLQISPDYQYIGHPALTLPGISIPTYNSVSTTSIATTTILGSNSVTTTVAAASTSVPATTTIATNATVAQVDNVVKNDRNYALMLNFSSLYASSKNCTPLAYNDSYFERFASFPSGPLSYANVSYETPYGLAQKIVSKGGSVYAYEFLAQVHDPAFNNTVALAINVNTASSTITSDGYSGIFFNSTYSQVNAAYASSKGVSGSCGALIG